MKTLHSYISICILSLLLANTTFGQNDSLVNIHKKAPKEFKNSIITYGGDYSISEYRQGYNLLYLSDDIVGIGYSKRYKRFEFQGFYSKWNSAPLYNLLTFRIPPIRFFYFKDVDVTKLKRGDEYSVGGYQYIDLGVMYNAIKYKRHSILLGGLISYGWGGNSRFDTITYYPAPPYDGIIYNTAVHRSYWGLVPKISYNFTFCRNRLSAGFDYRYRYYFGFMLNTYEYGFHLATNF